eukprot:gene22339-biopygen7197
MQSKDTDADRTRTGRGSAVSPNSAGCRGNRMQRERHARAVPAPLTPEKWPIARAAPAPPGVTGEAHRVAAQRTARRVARSRLRAAPARCAPAFGPPLPQKKMPGICTEPAERALSFFASTAARAPCSCLIHKPGENILAGTFCRIGPAKLPWNSPANTTALVGKKLVRDSYKDLLILATSP